MRRAALRLTAVCFLIGLTASVTAESPVRSGMRGKSRELHKIDQALQHARENKKAGERLVKQTLKEIERTKKALGSIRAVVSAKVGADSVVLLPDACKTPSPGGPVPIPYPNFASASDTSTGTKSVKVEGKQVAIKRGAYAKTASGDEAGSRALLEHLRAVRSEVEIRYDFVASICKKCTLLRTDKRTLQQWLTSTKKDIQRQQALFDDYVWHIEQVRRSYLQHAKPER